MWNIKKLNKRKENSQRHKKMKTGQLNGPYHGGGTERLRDREHETVVKGNMYPGGECSVGTFEMLLLMAL